MENSFLPVLSLLGKAIPSSWDTCDTILMPHPYPLPVATRVSAGSSPGVQIPNELTGMGGY